MQCFEIDEYSSFPYKIKRMIYKTLHLKRKTEQHKPHEKTGVSSGAPEGLAFDFDLFYLINRLMNYFAGALTRTS
jgi:hypothetical protein